MKLEVECYSGRTADERPVRFRLDGHEYMVEEILDQWYGPSDTFFKVRADDGNLYILRRDLGNHFKSGQRLSAQNRPTGGARNVRCFYPVIPCSSKSN